MARFAPLFLLLAACGADRPDSRPDADDPVLTWVRLSTDAVLTPALPWEGAALSEPAVLRTAGTLRMWYTGNTSPSRRIGTATSTDGVTWSRGAAPVLTTGPAGSWDATDVWRCAVLFDGAIYRMWYTGSSGGLSQVGVATSPDGLAWTKHPANPVLRAGAGFDLLSAKEPAVAMDGATYAMVYTGIDGAGNEALGRATSTDGVTWTKTGRMFEGAMPALADDRLFYEAGDGIRLMNSPDSTFRPAMAWEGGYVGTPAVLREAGQWRLWYSGAGGIGAAIAP